jgi:hypothetical protein
MIEYINSIDPMLWAFMLFCGIIIYIIVLEIIAKYLGRWVDKRRGNAIAKSK